MFCLSFTTPANAAHQKRRGQPGPTTTRAQVLLTWVLSVVWLGLMSFGIVSAADPEWLQELSRPGIEAECRAYKEYGDTALRQHNYNLAVGQYLRALEIKPDETSVWLNLGITYVQATSPRQPAISIKPWRWTPAPVCEPPSTSTSAS